MFGLSEANLVPGTRLDQNGSPGLRCPRNSRASTSLIPQMMNLPSIRNSPPGFPQNQILHSWEPLTPLGKGWGGTRSLPVGGHDMAFELVRGADSGPIWTRSPRLRLGLGAHHRETEHKFVYLGRRAEFAK